MPLTPSPCGGARTGARSRWSAGARALARAGALTLTLCAPHALAGAAAGAPPPDAEGPRLALACTGAGGAAGPAVVLEPGLGVPGLSSASLALLADALAAVSYTHLTLPTN